MFVQLLSIDLWLVNEILSLIKLKWPSSYIIMITNRFIKLKENK